MNRTAICLRDGRQSIDRITRYIEKTPLDGLSRGHGNCGAGVLYGQTPYQTFRTVHGNTTNAVLPQVLLNFQHQFFAIGTLQFQRIIYFREFPLELHIDYSADDLLDLTGTCHI